MNAKIEQWHRQRLADLMNSHPEIIVKRDSADFVGPLGVIYDTALQQIANADAAAREQRRREYAIPEVIDLICPDHDHDEEPKETENGYPRCPECGAPEGLDCRTIQGRIPPHEARLNP